MTTVAVLLPIKTFRVDFLRAAVSSVLDQTYSKLELWVIEAADSGDGARLLDEFDDERIRHVRMPASAVLVEQLNEGLRLIDASLVARMDGDDIARLGRIEKQLEFLQARPDVAVVGCQLHVIDEHGRSVGVRRYPTEPPAVAAAMRRYNALPHPGVMYRRQVVLDAGGYRHPERPAQDYELWSRLIAAGGNAANLSHVLLDYRLHRQSTKARMLHDTIRATLAVKRMHWRGRMTTGDRIRMAAEGAALHLPGPMLGWLFEKTQLSEASSAEQGGLL